MMDRNYPSSSFADAPAAAAQPAASWACDRGLASIKPSYGAAQLNAGLLQQHCYTSTPQLPTYTTAHLAPAAGALETNINTSETSIMSFLSSMESRSPVSASLLPPFRPPSWPAGTNPSTTELYLTGALSSATTFPTPAALSTYQHTGPYTSRSYSTNPALGLQEPSFSTSINGLLSHNDSILQHKPSQSILSTALAFNLTGPVSGSALPVESSTYRSAQESAPHLLQPQFSLLPAALPAPHSPSQSYGATVFSGSVERALQRECSVIKHHQRPSSSHIATELPPNSEDSSQSYYGSVGEGAMSYRQDSSCDTSVSCSPSTDTDSSHGVNSAIKHKVDSFTHSYSCTTVPTAKECSSKLTFVGREENQSLSQKQNSVIANQVPAQLPSLMSNTLSQTYITPHTQTEPANSSSDNLSSLYKTLPSISSLSANGASVSQALLFSPNPSLSQEQYGVEVQGLCQGSYPSSHSHTDPNVAYTSESQEQASVTQSQQYATIPSLNNSYQATSAHDYTQIQASVGHKTLGTVSQQVTVQTPHTSETVSATYSSTSQALSNNIRLSLRDIKPMYGKQTLEELSIQDLQALQQASMGGSAINGTVAAHNNVIYVVSKMEDLHKTQSVIKDSSRSADQLSQLNTAHVNHERLSSMGQHHSHLSIVNGQVNADPKTNNSGFVSSHIFLSPELKQRPLHIKLPESQQTHQDHIPAVHTQCITVPNAQVLLEPNQMNLLQQPLVQNAQMSSKVVSAQGLQSTQGLSPFNVQYLQMDREQLLCRSVSESQQVTVVSEQSSGCSDSSKDHYSHSANDQSNDAKNQFALNSLCFPDSVLLADERNILSNVDDILAATVAACGVTPQDFVKAASSTQAEIVAMTGSVDTKNHFQTVDITHMSPSFSTVQTILTGSNSMTMMINEAQISTDRQGLSVHHNSSDLDTNGDGESSENDYHSIRHVYDPSGLQSSVKGKCITTENGLMKNPGVEDFPQKKVCPLSLIKGEDIVQAKPAKRTVQAKRQNSRGSDSSPSASQSTNDSCPQQERIRQKIREVEEKQPEVKNGFIGSFLDFIKSGPKQQSPTNASRNTSRPKKTGVLTKPPPSIEPPKIQTVPGSLIAQQSQGVSSHQKRLADELQKNLETLPSFSSDEEENTGRNQALRNSISSALSALDEFSERKNKLENQVPISILKPLQVPAVTFNITETCPPPISTSTQTPNAVVTGITTTTRQQPKEMPPGQLAVQLTSVAIEGLTDEELSDSGGEGMYRERDEFVVRKEDIETLKETMRSGSEPPAIWKVQKALLQKFVPELRDGKRVFSATNSYLGYFGDAKTMYQRVYVKFLDTVNKREYVRVCSRKPRCKPMNSLRGFQVKTLLGLTAAPLCQSHTQNLRPIKPLKPRAEPPPKKRRKWKEALSPTASGSSSAEEADEDDLNPPVPFASRLLNTRTMKDTFKSFVELLISFILDESVMTELERRNDELLLPHMRRMDELISDNRKRLLHKLHIGQVLKTSLDSCPEISVVTELKKDGEAPIFKVRLSGKAYSKKTMKPYKLPNKVPQEYTVDQQKSHWFSLYHSLQHYKYHTYLMCKDEVLRVQAGEQGHQETVQKYLQNLAWVEGLFNRFEELINQVQLACR